MKKFLVTLLALSMMFAMAMPAFADTNIVYNDDLNLTNNTASRDVYASYMVTASSGFDVKVYRVLVGWGVAIEADEDHPAYRDWDYFRGDVTAVYKWNTDTLRYEATSKVLDDSSILSWLPFDIHVFNLSNAPVKAQLTYAAKEIEEDNPLSTVNDWGYVDLSSEFPIAKALLDSSEAGASNPYAVIDSCEDIENPHTAQGKVQGCEFVGVGIEITEAGKDLATADSNIAGTARTVLGTFKVTISAVTSGKN